MEKRDVIFLLLLFGGGSYATYANWDTISDKLGLQQLDPSRIKAIVLVKQASTFSNGATNWQHIKSQQALGKIEVTPDPWEAELITGQQYQVTVHWLDDDVRVAHGFRVNIATRTVVYEGRLRAAASPR